MAEHPGEWGREIILFEVPLATGGNLALIQSEQDICIKQNGELVSGCFWRPSQMPEAVQEFRHLSRAADRAPVDRPGLPITRHPRNPR